MSRKPESRKPGGGKSGGGRKPESGKPAGDPLAGPEGVFAAAEGMLEDLRPVAPPESTPESVSDKGHAEISLTRARAAWEMGDWAALAGLADRSLESHDDRAKLALLAAVGLAQLGDMAGARRFCDMARGWGCTDTLMAQVLIGGTLNSLGRVACLLDRNARARGYFEASIATVNPRADAAILGRARDINEKAALGLLPEAVGAMRQSLNHMVETQGIPGPTAQILQTQMEMLDRSLSQAPPGWDPGTVPETPAGAVKPARLDKPDLPRFAAPVLARLQGQLKDAGQVPFLLETKSLPRAGLHFIERTLAAVFGEAFSFCEWYQEPGCCRRMPCAVSSHLLADPQTAPGMLRMTKSHDFYLKDPVYPLSPGFERLVLVRDPLFSLTSWWVLDELQRHGALLREQGIPIERVFFRHEPKVIAAARDILDAHYKAPKPAALSKWLKKRTGYMAGFADKWADTGKDDPDGRTRLVRYDRIPAYLSDLVARKTAGFPEAQKRHHQALLQEKLAGFHSRKSPFSSASSPVLGFINANRQAFEAASAQLLQQDEKGVFSGS